MVLQIPTAPVINFLLDMTGFLNNVQHQNNAILLLLQENIHKLIQVYGSEIVKVKYDKDYIVTATHSRKC
jgi:hypothetical protein